MTSGQITLFNYGSKALRLYANEIQRSGGTAKQVASKQMLAFTERLGQLWREAQRAAIELGSVLAPAITRVADKLRSNMEAFKEYVKANTEAIMHTMKWTVVISGLLIVGGPLLIIITSLITKMVALAAVIANPFIVLIASLYVLRAVWNQTSDEMKQRAMETADSVAQSFKERMVDWLGGLLPEGARRDFLAGAREHIERPERETLEPLDFKTAWGEAISAVTTQLKQDFDISLGFVGDKLEDTDGLVKRLVDSFREYTAS
ncbi:unnamed protein product, partial [marine sediment metagenome]